MDFFLNNVYSDINPLHNLFMLSLKTAGWNNTTHSQSKGRETGSDKGIAAFVVTVSFISEAQVKKDLTQHNIPKFTDQELYLYLACIYFFFFWLIW